MTNTQMLQNPQNPYHSFLVNASAGTGKTYQLSQRFLHLVAAHAEPSKILAVTFTVKAGQEMRERILEQANTLLACSKTAEEFDLTADGFWKQKQQVSGEQSTETQKPRTAAETALCILQSSSNLQIQTLDSLLGGWLRSYGRLSALDAGEIASEEQLNQIETVALQELLKNLDEKSMLESVAKSFPQKGVKDVLTRVLAARKLGINPGEFGATAVLDADSSGFSIKVIKDGYGEFATPSGKKTFESLPDTLQTSTHAKKLLTLKNTLKLQLFKSKGAPLDQANPQLRTNLEIWCRKILALEQAQSLALKHKLLKVVYALFQEQLYQKKKEKGLWDFSDIEQETSALFSQGQHVGIQYFLFSQVSHLLIDEFQDTSSRQWSALSPLVEELLSGQAFYDHTSVFLVGDPKQSIYGFRGAMPELMTGDTLKQLNLNQVELTKSYRSSEVILGGANSIFPQILEGTYSTHTPSGTQPNQGSIELIEPQTSEEPQDKKEKTEAETEAKRVARKIAAVLKDPNYKVWDKEKKHFRPSSPGDVAILLWAKTRGEEYIEALEDLGIPCEFWDGGDPLLELPEIRDLEQLLRLSIFPVDDLAIWSVFSSPVFSVPASTLAEVWKTCLEAEIKDDATTKANAQADPTSTEPSSSRFTLLARELKEQVSWDPEQTRRVDVICAYLDQPLLAGRPYNRLWTARGFWALLQNLNWIGTYQNTLLKQGKELRSVQAGENARLFCEALFQLERKVNEPFETLDKLRSYRSLDIAWLPKSNASPGGSKLKVMSIHKSKGLEFPVVCIPELGRDWVRPDQYWVKSKDDHSQVALRYIGSKKENQFMPDDPDVAGSKEASNREKARLLYVAWTRARQHLFLSWDKEAFFAQKLVAADAKNKIFTRTDESRLEAFPPNLQADESDLPQTAKLEKLAASWSPSPQSKTLWIHSPSETSRLAQASESPKKEAGKEASEEGNTENNQKLWPAAAGKPDCSRDYAPDYTLDYARLAGIWLHSYFEQRIHAEQKQQTPAELWQSVVRLQEPRLWNWLRLSPENRSRLAWYPEETPDKLSGTFQIIQADAEQTWNAEFWQTLLASAKNIYCERSLRCYEPKRHKYVRAQCDLWIDLKQPENRKGLWRDLSAPHLIADFKSTHLVKKMELEQRQSYTHSSGTAQQLLAYAKIAQQIKNQTGPSKVAGFVIWSAIAQTDCVFSG